MSMSIDEEDGSNNSDPREVCVSPVTLRFTDYYLFATTRGTEELVQDYEAETALLTIDENWSDEKMGDK